MAPMNMDEDGYEVRTTETPYPEVHTQGPEVMQPNSSSDLARLGYAHGMWGIERELSDPTYAEGYTQGVLEWSWCMDRARGKA